MNARYADVAFDEGDDFELPLRFEREALAQRFADLKDDLLAGLAGENAVPETQGFLKQVAGEAAGLAWSTGYPLLVFPALFEELARHERVRAHRQQRIIARTENLLEAVV